MDEDTQDELVNVLPVHFANALEPGVHIHQFPLLTRPLHTPPSAAASGKRITSRIKPTVRRVEIHVPADIRPEVWNKDRGKDLGAAQMLDDQEKNQLPGEKVREGDEPRLSEVRLRSEPVKHQGSHMLGIVRDGHLHLHPISETHQFRPSLTYLDVLSRKTRRSSANGGQDSDSDDGPPPDPDEPQPSQPAPKKEKKLTGDAREVQVSAKRSDEKSGGQHQGGLSAVRREILKTIRDEEDDAWQDLKFCEVETAQSEAAFESLFSQSGLELICQSDSTTFLKDVPGVKNE